MSGRVALVTGGNDGIGFEIVHQLAEKGFTVWLAARSAQKGTDAASKLNGMVEGGRVHFVELDVTKPDTIQSALQTVQNTSGRLDILINNAGIGGMHRIPDQKPSSVDSQLLRDCFETNFFGMVQTTNAFIPLMQKSELPVIVLVSTDMASTTTQAKPNSHLHVAAYNTSKAAANSYIVGLAHDLPHFKINAVTPGYTSTKLNGFSGPKSTADAAALIVKYALVDKDGPTSQFFYDKGELPW
eukprot:TRINITY_DN4070_c0_g2_i1.p1 TRINITY_DN4070_c0_g2~~TRINITY_DN4070_c0_g2_i1.p1  ORF type:complete len:242 (+),score=57.45 TRINITY_DN4070_c0_g2_i1:252-977(+)